MDLGKKLLPFGLAAVSALAIGTASTDASAAFLEAGVQAGYAGRSLAGTDYKPGFNTQIHADLALIPPILMLGAYVNGWPIGGDFEPKDAKGDVKKITFRSYGLRGKLRIPVPGPVTPYGIAGIGLVTASFPETTLTVCDPYTGMACAQQKVADARSNFVEFVLGVGLMIQIAGPLNLTLEGAWRPSTGYTNDDYQKALAAQNQSAPAPSRTGYAWTALGGLALSL